MLKIFLEDVPAGCSSERGVKGDVAVDDVDVKSSLLLFSLMLLSLCFSFC